MPSASVAPLQHICTPLVANGCVDWQVNGWIAEVGDIELVDGGAWYAKSERRADVL